ncbi:hypothetical protein J6590_033888, partial [Homalodisca vitripennis]
RHDVCKYQPHKHEVAGMSEELQNRSAQPHRRNRNLVLLLESQVKTLQSGGVEVESVLRR